MSGYYLIRIHAQMFPIGPRFLVTCGRSDEQHGQERWLTEHGWIEAPEIFAKTPTLERVRRQRRRLWGCARSPPLGSIAAVVRDLEV